MLMDMTMDDGDAMPMVQDDMSMDMMMADANQDAAALLYIFFCFNSDACFADCTAHDAPLQNFQELIDCSNELTRATTSSMVIRRKLSSDRSTFSEYETECNNFGGSSVVIETTNPGDTPPNEVSITGDQTCVSSNVEKVEIWIFYCYKNFVDCHADCDSPLSNSFELLKCANEIGSDDNLVGRQNFRSVDESTASSFATSCKNVGGTSIQGWSWIGTEAAIRQIPVPITQHTECTQLDVEQVEYWLYCYASTDCRRSCESDSFGDCVNEAGRQAIQIETELSKLDDDTALCAYNGWSSEIFRVIRNSDGPTFDSIQRTCREAPSSPTRYRYFCYGEDNCIENCNSSPSTFSEVNECATTEGSYASDFQRAAVISDFDLTELVTRCFENREAFGGNSYQIWELDSTDRDTAVRPYTSLHVVYQSQFEGWRQWRSPY